jgi:hypothetical protein
MNFNSNSPDTNIHPELRSSPRSSVSNEVNNGARSSTSLRTSSNCTETTHFLDRDSKSADKLFNSHRKPSSINAVGRHPRQQDLFIETNVQADIALPHVDETGNTEATKEKPVTWRSLPRKDQLLVLTLARLSEPLTQTSLGSYIYYQLQSFDPSLPDSVIASQAGLIHAAFPAAQFLTAILWGRFADSEYGGRKRVIWIGLLGTMISIIGFGFSRSFAMAVCWRCLGGVLNGNIGVMRTMISEIIKEKKYQSRAFLILPMTFNIGVIVGPILGNTSFCPSIT